MKASRQHLRPDLTEECFQQNHLDFLDDKQWVVDDAEPDVRKEVDAIRARENAFPPHSQWSKNPVNWHEHIPVHIFDYVEVPIYLEMGKYVLSFRWDCTNTSQV